MPSGKTFGTLAPIATILSACAFAWLFPRTAARRTQRLPLSIAFGTHVLALFIAGLTIFLAIAWGWSGFGTAYEILRSASQLRAEIEQEWDALPGGFVSIVLAIAAGVEVFHLAVAVILSPWGARDEPIRDSLIGAIRQAWLHTAHFAVAAAIVIFTAAWLHRVDERLRASHPPPEYNTAVVSVADAIAFERAYAEWQLTRPWYIRWDETTIALLIFICLFWIFWSLLRAIGADREVPIIARPPTCLACGYNLTATPLNARCPECGRAVIDSLGDAAQPGVPWEHRRTRGRIVTYAQTAATAIFRPSTAGLMMRLTADPSHHRFFFWPHIPFVWTIAASAVLTAMYFADGGADQLRRDPTPMLIGASVFGVVCCMGFVCFTCLSALLIGLLQSWRTRRNLLAAAMRAACYLAPALLAWEVLGAMVILIAAMLVESGFFESFEQRTGIFRGHALLVFVFLPNLLGAFTFVYFVNLITSAARHANR